MHLIRGLKATGKESGQMLVLFALLLPLLLCFVGFAIDFGFGFLTKAQLAKAVDAAALATMRNLGRGPTTAKALGQAEFALNVNAASGLFVSAPAATINIVSVPGSQPIVDVKGTAQIKTFFIGIAGFHTLTIANFSEATRPPVILSLVLDRSGSMSLNGGSTALPPAVLHFLDYFIEGTDRLGEVSFASTNTPDVAITQTFHTPIQNSLNRMTFDGATFSYGGLLDAQTQVTGVASPPANAVNVVVFFTDGYANTNQDKLGGSLVNYGGCASAEFTAGICRAISCMDPTTGDGPVTIASTTNSVASCNGVQNFPAQDRLDLTNPAPLTIRNLTTEAEYRSVQMANAMRAQGITVYSIGLGDNINKTFLEQIANDPASPVFDPNQPRGIAVFAGDSTDLDTSFQDIASKIVLRLTQ